MPDEATSPPPPPPLPHYPLPYGVRPRSHSAWFYIAVIGGSCALVALVLAFALPRSARHGRYGGFFANTDQIAVVDITGVILSADKIDAELRSYADDDTVKAIVLHINSPGGASSPSQEIYNEVLRLRREKHKKIVASIDSVGASGAYYIASACDRIYANQASIVGSIGVVMEWTNYGELMRWAKLKSVDIHAGELKTAGDPARDPTPKEQAYFQSLVDNMYGQFIRDVATARHTTEDKIRPFATGQVWTGQQALGLGLIDREGGFRVALMDTAHESGISGEPTIVRTEKQNTFLAQLLSGTEDVFPNPAKLLEHEPGFYFLWK